MTPRRISIDVEKHTGTGPEGRFCLGDSQACLEGLLDEYEGRIKLIYMDPPYMTGSRFTMRVRVGEAGWKGLRGMPVETFSDYKDRNHYLEMMRRVMELCKQLLSEDGMIFVHIDYRAHPYIRLLMDELFGEQSFLNEIVWVYQTGGRSTRHFSRKHDIILFYRKSERYDFNIEAVKAPSQAPKANHMRRHVDPDGRVYRSIKVSGRLYTYYDDDPVAPSDVWSDLSHLQQRDPERTGYDTQKPLALLKRIVLCASRPGEWVLDPFAGSSTTLEAAKLLGRNFIGVDAQPLTTNIARRRLQGARYGLFNAQSDASEPEISVSVNAGIGFYHVNLDDFRVEVPFMPEGSEPMDCVDNWSVGYLRNGQYEVMAEFARNMGKGALERELRAPAYAGRLAMCISDVLGRSYYYALDTETAE